MHTRKKKLRHTHSHKKKVKASHTPSEFIHHGSATPPRGVPKDRESPGTKAAVGNSTELDRGKCCKQVFRSNILGNGGTDVSLSIPPPPSGPARTPPLPRTRRCSLPRPGRSNPSGSTANCLSKKGGKTCCKVLQWSNLSLWKFTARCK